MARDNWKLKTKITAFDKEHHSINFESKDAPGKHDAEDLIAVLTKAKKLRIAEGDTFVVMIGRIPKKTKASKTTPGKAKK